MSPHDENRSKVKDLFLSNPTLAYERHEVIEAVSSVQPGTVTSILKQLTKEGHLFSVVRSSHTYYMLATRENKMVKEMMALKRK